MITEVCEIGGYLLKFDNDDNEIIFYKREYKMDKRICFFYCRDKIENFKFLIDNNEYVKNFGDLEIILHNEILTIKMIGDNGEEILKLTDVFSFKEFLSKSIKYNSKYLRKSKIEKLING